MSAQIVEAVDLSDLDALDEDEQHIFCVCQIVVGNFSVSEAMCGKRAVCYGRILEELPLGICEGCEERAWDLCPRCGE
jgi:hypothetical protein